MLPLLLKEHQTGMHRFDALLFRRSFWALLLNVMNVVWTLQLGTIIYMN